MNIKAMRNVHLYLGCFFTPLLVLFLITGCWQTFDLHKSSKDKNGYKAPAIVQSLSQVHTDQRWSDNQKHPESSIPFRYLILLMSLGLLVTTILGVVMAFKYTRPWLVWACLILGFLIPFFFLWMARGYADDISPTDEIVVKATDAVMFQITANVKLTPDQVDAVRPIVTDNIVKLRSLQQSVEDGSMDSKTMYAQHQQLISDEDQELSHFLSSDQMKIIISLQENQVI